MVTLVLTPEAADDPRVGGALRVAVGPAVAAAVPGEPVDLRLTDPAGRG